jgi:hypothetical protein
LATTVHAVPTTSLYRQVVDVLRPRWDLGVGLAAYAAAVGVLLSQALALTGGHLVYALDDGYIHMSLARHVVQDGVWGLSSDSWASASSSLLWPVLLVALYLPGPWAAAPLVLNLVFSCLALFIAHGMLRRGGLAPATTAAVLVLLVWLTPLATLTMEGMEHTLQICTSLAFLHLATRALAEPRLERGTLRALLAAAAAVTATRYEGAFLVALAAGLFLLQRRARTAAAVALAGGLPIIAYGVVSLAKGGYFLPNPVVIKAPSGWVSPVADPYIFFLREPFYVFRHNEHLFVLMLAALALLALRSVPWSRHDERSYGLLLFAAAAYLQFTFGRPGWGWRYEAYLVFLGIVVLALAVGDAWVRRPRSVVSLGVPRLLGTLLLAGVVLYPVAVRADDAWNWTARASANMYEQPYQTALFLQTYYSGSAVALLDVGAPTYYAEIQLLDLAGLGSNQVARESPHHWLPPERAHELAQEMGVRIAVLGKTRPEIGGGVPSEWTEVGSWRIFHNVASGQDTITFFGTSPEEAQTLTAHLREFAPRLPPTVEQSGPYTEGA